MRMGFMWGGRGGCADMKEVVKVGAKTGDIQS